MAIAPTSDVDGALTTSRPFLIVAAQLQLRNRNLDEQLAEDLVQEAMARWIAAAPEYRGERPLYGWLKTTIPRLAAEIARRRPDVLDHCSYSLDEPWARGD